MSYCLGIQFIRNGSKIIMHHKRYIEDILKHFGMTESKPIRTSMEPDVKLTLPEDASDTDIQKLPYRELIIYLSGRRYEARHRIYCQLTKSV